MTLSLLPYSDPVSRPSLILLKRRPMSQWAAMVIINGTAFAMTAGVFVAVKAIDALFDIR